MSVRVNDRHLSEIEYENTYGKLNEYISSKLKRLPKRYRHFLGEPFNNVLNSVYFDIIELTNLHLANKSKSVERYRLCAEILRKMEDVISMTYTYWNLSGDNQNEVKYVNSRQRAFWSDFIKKEIALISGVISKCHEDKKMIVVVPHMMTYAKSDIKEVVFLDKLSTLQRIIYKRAIHMSKDYKDARMEMLVELSRSALYNAIQGNGIMVGNDQKLYDKRRKFISDAIGDLYAMNRPIRELSFCDTFREKELCEICNLITESMKILRAVRESDEIAFAR